jgi:hypothetical protein
LPEAAMVLGAIALQASPAGRVSVRVTVPAKWLRPVIVMVEFAETVTSAGGGELAVSVKFWKMNVTIAVCTSGLLVPVTVTV